MSKDALTEKQSSILNYIKETVSTKGYPPSVREIGQAVGLKSSSTVHTHLNKLAAMGYIKKDATKPRAIDVLEEAPWRQKNIIPVPLVGVVTAGQPIQAIENIEETFPLPADLVGGDDNVFMLEVKGESMIKAGILNGDYIMVREQRTANNGDIVVALIDEEEATVKRFYQENNRYRLQPENDAMEPIIVDNVSIVGKVVGVFRSM